MLEAWCTEDKEKIPYFMPNWIGIHLFRGGRQDVKHICQVITSRCSHIQTQSSKEIMREKKSLSLLLENTIRVGERTISRLV